jgi:hypothetical protein
MANKKIIQNSFSGKAMLAKYYRPSWMYNLIKGAASHPWLPRNACTVLAIA